METYAVFQDRTLTHKIKAFGRLARLHASATPPLYLWAGALANGYASTQIMIVLFAMGLLVGMGYMALNDYFDLEIDRRSENVRSERPLITGEISPFSGLVFGLSCVFLIFILSFLFLSIEATVATSLALVLGLIYDMFNKTAPGLDMVGSLSVPAAVMAGALAVSHTISPLAWAFIIMFGARTIFQNIVAGGIKDLRTDKDNGARNTAIHLTKDATCIPRSLRTMGYGLSALFVLALAYVGLTAMPLSFVIVLSLLFLPVFLITLDRQMPRKYDREVTKNYTYPHEILAILAMFVVLAFVQRSTIPLALFVIPVIWFLVWSMVLYGRWKPSV